MLGKYKEAYSEKLKLIFLTTVKKAHIISARAIAFPAEKSEINFCVFLFFASICFGLLK